MNGSKLVLLYSFRLVKREWRRFVLPFFSFGVTAIVLMLILLLSNASTLLLAEQARELLGGDVAIESNTPVAIEEIWNSAELQPEAVSRQLSFSGTLQSGEETAPFSVKVVDEAFPLYGEIGIQDGAPFSLTEQSIYLDEAGAERLGVSVGEQVSFGETSYKVAGIIISEPTSLLGGFGFLPQAIISEAGFLQSSIDLALLRIEYIYAAKVPMLSSVQKEALSTAEDASDGVIDVDIAGENRGGLQRGVQTVAEFLVVAVVITAVLAAVNVYASTLYLVTVERKSFAILLALGLTKRRLVAVLAAALGYAVVLASIVGAVLGYGLFSILTSFVSTTYGVSLPTPSVWGYGAITIGLIITIATASFLPAMERMLSLNPKQILIGGESAELKGRSFRSVLFITGTALLPLAVLAIFLLQDIITGVLLILAIMLVYVTIAVGFIGLLNVVYRQRSRFSFFTRSIISQKKADGLFGIVSFTSLFVALAALSTLSLLQISIERYLTEDIARTIPSTYVLDVQPSQRDALLSEFPDIDLFSNIPSRIIQIDDVRIQEALDQDDPTVSRELGREFNLTARRELLSSEVIVDGEWKSGAPGEISVDEDFAKRANISLGSEMRFSIQGFEVTGVVTSLRQTDSRSGLPFFYFVMSPDDIGMFPATYFGYAYYDEVVQADLGRYLATEAPNVSVIETQAIGPLLIQIVETLMVLILVVTLPPLLIATLLIATLVVSSFTARRREGVRLQALGATRTFVQWQYIVETISLTLVAAVLAYGFSIGVTYIVGYYYLQLDRTALFDGELVLGVGLIIVLVALLGLYLFKKDKTSLRELLSYGETS